VATILAAAAATCAGIDPSPLVPIANGVSRQLEEVLTTRYLEPRITIPASVEWRTRVLESYPDEMFKKFMRMYKVQFNTLTDLLSVNDRFTASAIGRQPEHPREQLKVCLYRLGGKSITLDQTAALMGVSKGAADRYFWTCVWAICDLAERFIKWPDPARRSTVKEWFLENYSLPHVIGAVDGVHIPLNHAPSLRTSDWNTYKCRYALGVTAVCDHECRFTYLSIGHIGSSQDSTSFKDTELFERSNIFFNGDDYIVGDKGYALLPCLMTPFKKNEGATPARELYNSLHKGARGWIENAFGRLKNKFQTLKSLPVDIASDDGVDNATSVVLACATLHNFLLCHHGDRLVELPPNNFMQHASQLANVLPVEVHDPRRDRRDGVVKRDAIVSMVENRWLH